MPEELTLDYIAIRLLSDAEHAIGRLVAAVEITGRKRDQVFVAHEILKFMGKR
jgi:hypothetical protein